LLFPSPDIASRTREDETKEDHMRTVIIALLAIMVAGSAAANPIQGNWLYIDFDPPNYTHEIYPEILQEVHAYLMLSQPDLYPTQGFTTISFALSITPGMSSPPAFINLLPGGLAIGVWDVGITMASTQCEVDFPVPIGYLSFLYLGTPGDIAIIDHPDYPRWIVDCQEPGQVFEYCVYWNGGVGKEGVQGDCGVNPVEDTTWGGIKSLYR
jgi:hypothetical protein